MTGALVSGVAAIVTFAALLVKRIAVEERALRTRPDERACGV